LLISCATPATRLPQQVLGAALVGAVAERREAAERFTVGRAQTPGGDLDAALLARRQFDRRRRGVGREPLEALAERVDRAGIPDERREQFPEARAAHLGARAAENRESTGIRVDHAAGGVGDHDPVAQVVDHVAASQRERFEELIAKHPECEHHQGAAEHCRRRVVCHRPQPANEEQAGDGGKQRGAREQRGARPLARTPHASRRDQEQRDASDHHRVGEDQVRVEERPALGESVRDEGAEEELVLRRGGEREQRQDGRHEEGERECGSPLDAAHAREARRHQEPERRHGGDPDPGEHESLECAVRVGRGEAPDHAARPDDQRHQQRDERNAQRRVSRAELDEGRQHRGDQQRQGRLERRAEHPWPHRLQALRA
jgi:hypothetical protein